MSRIFRYDNEELTKNNAGVPEYQWLSSVNLAQLSKVSGFACNIRVLEQGKYSYPYHFHRNAEEMFIILKGNGKLRIPDGVKDISAGDIIIFECGESGAHQVYNHGDESLVYLDIRTCHSIDVCEYPDSGKVNILPQRDIFYKGEKADYFDGEEGVSAIWSKLLQD